MVSRPDSGRATSIENKGYELKQLTTFFFLNNKSVSFDKGCPKSVSLIERYTLFLKLNPLLVSFLPCWVPSLVGYLSRCLFGMSCSVGTRSRRIRRCRSKVQESQVLARCGLLPGLLVVILQSYLTRH